MAVAVKFHFENDIRRVSLQENPTYTWLVNLSRTLFACDTPALQVTEPLFHYKNAAGQFVQILTTENLEGAFSQSTTSTLSVFISLPSATSVTETTSHKSQPPAVQLADLTCSWQIDAAKEAALRKLLSDSPGSSLTNSVLVEAAREFKLEDLTKSQFPPIFTPSGALTTPLDYNSAYVRDVTIPDGSKHDLGVRLTKTWVIRNTGKMPWTKEFVVYNVATSVPQDRPAWQVVKPTPIGKIVEPGTEAEITVTLDTPEIVGRYTSYFRLALPTQETFGDRFWLKIATQEVVIPEEEQKETTKLKAALAQLKELGCTDVEKNLKALLKYNGNVAEAVMDLLE